MRHESENELRSNLALPLDAPASVALRRLIEEVRNESGGDRPTAYNRTYHRHNR